MILFTLVTFSAIVILIAIVTHKLNSPVPCDHDWKETENGLRCTKCLRTIRRDDEYDLSREVPIIDPGHVYSTQSPPRALHQQGLDLPKLRENSLQNL